MGTPDSSVPIFLTARVNRSSETFEVLLCCICHQGTQAPIKAWRPVSTETQFAIRGQDRVFHDHVPSFVYCHRIATSLALAEIFQNPFPFIGVDSSWDNHVHEGTLIANVEQDHSGVMDVC